MDEILMVVIIAIGMAIANHETVGIFAIIVLVNLILGFVVVRVSGMVV
jgi:hypothetical protein